MSCAVNRQVSIAQRRPLVKKLLLIEGISRTGKFLLGNILDGLQYVDHYQAVSILEHVSFLERLKMISEEAAISFIQMAVDEHAYHMQIGRNLNFRRIDKSSLYQSFRESEYLRRMKSRDDFSALESFERAKYYSTFIVHEGMPNIKIFFKAYPSIKIISILRHPVDLVFSWYLRGWGQRETKDPRSFQPCIALGKESVPWYALRDFMAYSQFNRIDRIIRIIASLFDMSAETVKVLTPRQKKRILFITYEDLVGDTHYVLREIVAFLKTKPCSVMSKILKRECCPNSAVNKNRNQKLQHIKKRASKLAFHSLLNLIERYEKHKAMLFLV